MLRFTHSTVNFNKKSYRIGVCGVIEIEFHLTFYWKFRDAAWAKFSNKVCDISIDNKLAVHFECLSNGEPLRIFLFDLSDPLNGISLAIFAP